MPPVWNYVIAGNPGMVLVSVAEASEKDSKAVGTTGADTYD
jgi:hypothetical protein